MKRMYSTDEAYAILASDSDITNTASDFDPDQYSDTDSVISDNVTDNVTEAPESVPRSPPPKRPATAPESTGDGATWVPPNATYPEIPPFSADPGVNLDVANFTPIQYLNIFLGDDIMQVIATHTNLYAAQYLASHPRSYIAKSNRWYPTDTTELKKFWALTLCMGIIKKPTLRSYWSKDPVLETPIFSHSMKRVRYEMLLRFLHFSDNSICPPKDHPSYDRLYKIRPLITHLQTKFAEAYTPQRNIAIDESLMKFKGRLGFKQYIPSKKSRYGIKFYKLCESGSGYTWAFRVYEGKDSHLDPPGCPDFLGTSAKIVWELLIPLLGKGYHLYLDNFYTSVPLFRILYCLDTVACGTIRKNRKGFPKELSDKRLTRGATSALRQEELLAVKFRDKKDVLMITTIHDESTIPVTVRGKAEMLRKPVCIKAYNKHMGGVDLSDQLLQPYLAIRKTRAWYKKVAIYMMHIATYNSYILFRKNSPGKIPSFLQYQLNIIKGILPHQAPATVRTTVRTEHFIFKIPPTPKKAKPQRRCRVCSRKGKRTDTIYHCPDCPAQPALCLGTCFKEFHLAANL
ncbi:piggyBac transposable element-derived protein 4-like [Bombina bombina]|uniref:piggyBac transposable element-derived protein 4-like n=1 Tax=Bombina bombina TaxID=8345 RepID=UPI00235ACFE2|nr:piggyBac transposable element-derived protein 4-like [Bombina bombina]